MHKLFTKTLLGLLALFAPLAYAQSVLGPDGTIVAGPNAKSCSANTTSAKCIGISPYVAVSGDYTTAVQQAITDLYNAGGGTVYFPDGNYPINGPLQDTGVAFTGTTAVGSTNVTVSSTTGLARGNPIYGPGLQAGTMITAVGTGAVTISTPALAAGTSVAMTAAGANAVIVFPKVSTGTGIPIFLQGLSVDADYGFTGGAHITTNLNSGNLFGGYNSAGPFGGMIYSNFHMANFTINDSSTNPCAVIVNTQSFLTSEVKGVTIVSGAPGTPACVQGGGVIMPHVSNDVRDDVDRLVIIGFYIGLQIGEHVHIGSLLGANNYDMVLVDDEVATSGSTNGPESNSADYIWCQVCTNVIAAGNTEGILVAKMVDAEVPVSSVINDPNNVLKGAINLQVAYNDGRSTSTRANPVINGAANVSYCNVYNNTCHGLTLSSGADVPLNITGTGANGVYEGLISGSNNWYRHALSTAFGAPYSTYECQWNGSVHTICWGGAKITVPNTTVYGFSSGAADATAMDTGLSRVSAGILGVGTGAQGAINGTIEAAKVYGGPNATTHDAAVGATFSSTGTHTAELEQTGTTTNRTAFILSGNPGGTYTNLWEFGTDLSQNLTKDYYIYNYGTSRVSIDINPDDSITYPFTVAPTGACANTGSWAFTKDGHVSFCSAGTWVAKI